MHRSTGGHVRGYTGVKGGLGSTGVYIEVHVQGGQVSIGVYIGVQGGHKSSEEYIGVQGEHVSTGDP